MRKSGRSIFGVLAGIVACANLPVFDSSAQGYPVKPIRMLVGLSPAPFTPMPAVLHFEDD
jgi:hypothetical protein